MSVDRGRRGLKSSEASQLVAVGGENTVLTTPLLLRLNVLFTRIVNLEDLIMVEL